MSDKFLGKYRNESARLHNWDYGSTAAYFITICTKDREHYLGEINDYKMQVSPAGAIANVLWYEIKNHAKNIELGEFVVMPNHIHGILILNKNRKDDANIGRDDAVIGRDVAVIGRDVAVIGRDVACNVPTITPSTTGQSNKNEFMAAISPKPNTVSSIIRSYKSAVTKYCNRLELDFAWQPRFYDHIIRNDESFQKISEYIKNNPSKWSEDKLYQ
jgi:REP element-mobilizing transposase RayT